MLFSKTHAFVTLEDPDIRILAKEDPRRFLEQYKPPVNIDKIQYVPELLSYIKTMIDQRRKPGQWLFTCSQNFTLMQGVSESLAGRAAILSLLPFSFSERINNAQNAKETRKWLKGLNLEQKDASKISLSQLILRGNYPEVASKPKVDRQLWCSSYITTYLERDVRNISAIGDLSQFERFLRLCATRTGQILNMSEMARDIGVSVPTAKRWIFILETGYQIYLLSPYYKNIGKSIIKSPKLYFTDTALASYLLGLNTAEALINGPSFSHLFETMIINAFLKRFLHFGQLPSMYYLRSRNGLEIDLAIECDQKLYLFEIKSAMTITNKHASSLRRLRNELGPYIKTSGLISCSPINTLLKNNVVNYNWRNILAV